MNEPDAESTGNGITGPGRTGPASAGSGRTGSASTRPASTGSASPGSGAPERELPTNDAVCAELSRTLPGRRFFAEKASGIAGVDVVHRQLLDETVELFIVRVRLDDRDEPDTQPEPGDHPESAGPLYFVPIAWSPAHHSSGTPPLVDTGDLQGHDALADGGTSATVAAALTSESIGDVSFHLLDGADAPTSTGGRPMGVEQSNTSVIFGDGLMCKFFRRLHAGPNPDVELSAALTDANCAAIPPLTGWAEIQLGGEDFTVAMWQSFIPGTSDGWALALDAARAAVTPDGAGPAHADGDFTEAAATLGAAVAEVHRALAPVEPAGRCVPADQLVAPMRERLAHVAGVVPRVAELSDAISRVYDTAAASGDGDFPVQRIHGDLHLGQVLRAPDGWKLIDFEGEPSRPWAQRREPDHPLRDIAGMIRSFDYAAHFPLMADGGDGPGGGDGSDGDGGDGDGGPDGGGADGGSGRAESEGSTESVEAAGSAEPKEPSRTAATAAGWSAEHAGAFLRGYRGEIGSNEGDSPVESALLDAYVLDKAVYECLYEAQHRPDWLPIPLAAVERILGIGN